MNRKLIRPNFSEIKEKAGHAPKAAPVQDLAPLPVAVDVPGAPSSNPNAASVPQGTGSPRRKIAPPEQTNAESFYYLKQMQTKTPMVIVLQNDEKIEHREFKGPILTGAEGPVQEPGLWPRKSPGPGRPGGHPMIREGH